MTRLRALLDRSRRPALVAWVFVAGVGIVAAANGFLGNYLWAGFALAATAFAVLPSVVRFDPAVTLPWPVVAIAFVAVLGPTLGVTTTLTRVTTYLSVAAVALILAVELDAFTPVRLTPNLGIAFVVLATMAAAGIWVVVQWTANAVAGTGFYGGKTRMMWYLVGATVAGLLAGVLFELYFRQEETTDDERGSPGGAT